MPRSKANPAQRGQYARSEDTRARLLEAALDQASEAGFQNVSVASIAHRAGVATGILNYHFGSKKQLLLELMSSRVADFLSRLTPPDEGDDFFTYEETLLRTYLEFLHANPTYVRLAEEIRHHDSALYAQGTREHVTHICGRIQRGIEQGDLRAMNPQEIRTQAYLMQGAYTFFDRLLEDEDFPGDEAVLAATIQFLRGGMGRPATDPTHTKQNRR